MVNEAIASGWEVESIVLRKERESEADSFAPSQVYLTDTATFRQLSQHPHPEGILAVVSFQTMLRGFLFPYLLGPRARDSFEDSDPRQPRHPDRDG